MACVSDQPSESTPDVDHLTYAAVYSDPENLRSTRRLTSLATAIHQPPYRRRANMFSTGSTSPLNTTKTSHPIGFNSHTEYDPFFPSAAVPSEEDNWQPVEGERLARPLSFTVYSTPASANSSNSVPRNPTSSPPNIYDLTYQPLPNASNANGLHPAYIAHDEYQNVGTPNNLLSPHAPYLSDNGYTEASEHSATPEVDDDFYLETNYGLLDPEHELNSGRSPDPMGALPPGSISIGTYGNGQAGYKNSASSGKATLQSHLMSPMLTDTASPGSRDGKMSPTLEMQDLNGFSKEVSSAFFGQPQISGYNANNYNQMQYGLGLQGMQNNQDTERTVPDGVRVPSPRVHVESYSRGDSPSRAAGLTTRTGGKRSHGSSSPTHLAVQPDRDSSEEDDDNISMQDSQGTAVPADTQEDCAGLAHGRAGLDPQARLNLVGTVVPNFKDQERTAEVELKKADVEDWLARSAMGPQAGVDDPNKSKPAKPTALKKRLRARSAGDHNLSQANLQVMRTVRPDAHIPGPGVLLDIESGDEEEEEDGDDEDEDDSDDEEGLPDFVGPPDIVSSPEALDEAVSQAPVDRIRVWQDSLLDTHDPESKIQPDTSNDAMMRFKQRAEDFETVSLAATWGTRRLSDGELEGLFHRLSFKPVTQDKEKDEKRRGFFEQAAKLLSKKRDPVKRNQSENSKQSDGRPAVLESDKKNSLGSRHEAEVNATTSSITPTALPPRIDTSNAAVAFMQSNALGAGGSGNVAAASPSSPWTSAKNVIKRSRSRSDMQRPISPSKSKIAEMWTKQGGPPMPTLATPHQEGEIPVRSALPADLEDEDEDDMAEDRGVTMDLNIRADPIIPTLEGFRSNVTQLNPRLPKFMIDRIAQEQLRRYKKLVDFKVKHCQAINARKCESGKHCTELGGEPTYLPSKASTKEPELSHTGFSIAGMGGSDDDANALADGIVTAAQFPPGVPMPPVKRLPAEFECSLCFKVKKFHKPSDWSKHVHEDVQPFTCTFANCADPKSFKRKADWVRHENERHRQLEWWMCNMNDCTHKCYRKDNFVQHLVREHKLPEPKVKVAKPGKPAVRGPSAQKARTKAQDKDDANDDIDIVWRLVDECRHETPKNPKEEACKFCGNICNSWKKLNVHLAKHMEQISMPVLNVINQQNIGSDTIISPIDNHVSQTTTMSPAAGSLAGSPFPSGSSGYGNSNGVSSSPSSYPPLPKESLYLTQSNQSQATMQRTVSASSATYPPLPNYQPVGWGVVRGNPFSNTSIPGFKYEDLQPPSQSRDNSNSANRTGFTPKNLLTKFRSPSQPSTGPGYALPGDASHYPSAYSSPSQQSFTSAAENQPVFSYRAAPPTSFPTQQPLASTTATAMGFGSAAPEMSYSPAPSGMQYPPSPTNVQNLYNPPRYPQQLPQGGYTYLQR